MQGFHHRGEFDPPEWANNLKNYYWFIRVEGRDKAKRRKYYRKIMNEKLKLAETGVNQDQILAVCRYLATLKNGDGEKMNDLLFCNCIQLSFDFF